MHDCITGLHLSECHHGRSPEGTRVLHQIFGTQIQHAKKNWTQSDLGFCENEGSKRFKINEKWGHLDRKLRKIDTKCFKSVK